MKLARRPRTWFDEEVTAEICLLRALIQTPVITIAPSTPLAEAQRLLVDERVPALVVVDNAPIHTSDDFEEELERWQKEDLYVKFLPPYCPELNLIELLWRKIKYEWLPLDAYLNFKTLTASLFDVLKGVGSKYRITFA